MNDRSNFSPLNRPVGQENPGMMVSPLMGTGIRLNGDRGGRRGWSSCQKALPAWSGTATVIASRRTGESLCFPGGTRASRVSGRALAIGSAARHRASWGNALRDGAQGCSGRGRPPPHARRVRSPRPCRLVRWRVGGRRLGQLTAFCQRSEHTEEAHWKPG